MSRRLLLSVAILGLNAVIWATVPRPVSAEQQVGACGYTVCEVLNGLTLYPYCDYSNGVHQCGCGCDTPGASW